MTIRAPVPSLSLGRRTLDKDVSHYLCRVLRLDIGDHFVAFDPETRTEGDATIDVASGVAAEVTIADVRRAAVVAGSALVLIYALAKGDKVDAVVRDATELGATRVIVARASRSVPKGDKLDRWKRVAEQAARQCGRGDPPAIDGVLAWDEALAAAEDSVTKLCLVPGAETALGSRLPSAVGGSIAFAVGPEGGLTEEEIARAHARGFVAVSLGPFVLRTETVAAAVLGAIRVLS